MNMKELRTLTAGLPDEATVGVVIDLPDGDAVYGYVNARSYINVEDKNRQYVMLAFKSEDSRPEKVDVKTLPIVSMSNAWPKALKATLYMIYLVKVCSYARTRATHIVATNNFVHYQTVVGKYCRQLGIKAYEMDQLLEYESTDRLEALVIKKHQRFEEDIKEFFSSLS